MSIENKETNRSKPRYSVYRYAGMAASVTASYVSFKNQEVFAGISFAGLAGSLFGYEKSRNDTKIGNNGTTNRFLATLGGVASVIALSANLASASTSGEATTTSTTSVPVFECDVDMLAVVNGENSIKSEIKEVQSSLKLIGQDRYDPGLVDGVRLDAGPTIEALSLFANDNESSLNDKELCSILNDASGGYLDDGIYDSAVYAYQFELASE